MAEARGGGEMSWIREPVTKKAFAAISQYASLKAGELPIHHRMVKFVLEAEKMKRVDLYRWLERKGYRWVAKAGFWEKVRDEKALD
jgi:hypothetical protein